MRHGKYNNWLNEEIVPYIKSGKCFGIAYSDKNRALKIVQDLQAMGLDFNYKITPSIISINHKSEIVFSNGSRIEIKSSNSPNAGRGNSLNIYNNYN